MAAMLTVGDADLSERTAELKAALDAMVGATSELAPSPPRVAPGALLYKVMGKVFAILSIRGGEWVGLKCDPHLGEILREMHEGVGHYRLHLRNWIRVDLDADVPMEEALRLAKGSHELVCAGLTRRQRAELEGL
jgi:predicted DNA-binding protein (MmcQ/YjbR family)